MSSEAITRNDLTAILNEVLPLKPLDIQIKSGSVSVSSGTVTSLDTVDAPDTNAYYLLVGIVAPQTTSTSKRIFARLNGAMTGGEFRNGVAVESVNILKGNGSVFTLQTNHDYGSAQTIDYKFIAVKLS